MTGSEIQKIIESMPDDMKDVLLNGLNDAIEAMCDIANYMRKNFVPGFVIDDIKAEINELSELDHIEPTYEDCKRDVLEIINRRTNGAKMGGEQNV